MEITYIAEFINFYLIRGRVPERLKIYALHYFLERIIMAYSPYQVCPQRTKNLKSLNKFSSGNGVIKLKTIITFFFVFLGTSSMSMAEEFVLEALEESGSCFAIKLVMDIANKTAEIYGDAEDCPEIKGYELPIKFPIPFEYKVASKGEEYTSWGQGSIRIRDYRRTPHKATELNTDIEVVFIKSGQVSQTFYRALNTEEANNKGIDSSIENL